MSAIPLMVRTMSKAKAAAFTFAPFSKKQRIVLEWWMEGSPYKDKDGIICDGSIRSGKTTIMSLSYCLWAMTSFTGQNFAIAGKTIASLRRNVIGQLKRMLQGRGYTVEEHRADNCMTVTGSDSANTFYFFGGKDESSQDLIQGITLAGVFLDEAALMPESFVNQATGRCSVSGSKIWFNCNPEGPTHYIKTDWIDRLSARNFIRVHFTMRDNPSLDSKIRKRYENMYSGLFHARYIEGLWSLATGVIFRYLAEEPEKYTFSPGEPLPLFSKLTMGIDFGGNESKTTFVLTGYIRGYKEFRILEEYGLPVTESIDSEAICNAFVNFYKLCNAKYGRVDWIFPDSASTTLINSLRNAARKAGLRASNIRGCRKNEIKDRPRSLDMLLTSGRLKISESCREVIGALSSLVWDEKKPDIPEDKNIGNCNDWYDAVCYCFLDFIEFIDLER